MSSTYLYAANALKAFLEERTGLHNIIYGGGDTHNSNSKTQVFALVIETLRYKPILDELIIRCFNSDKLRVNQHLLSVVLYEHMFSDKRQISGGGCVKKMVLKHKAVLASTLARMMIKAGVAKYQHLLPIQLRRDKEQQDKQHIQTQTQTQYRYIRVNTLLTTVDAVIAHVQQEGYVLVASLSSLVSPSSFCVDSDIPCLLVFSLSVAFHAHPLLLSGHIIIQDKASCFPALCLNPGVDDHVVDGCAAPGNKTSQLLAIMNDKYKQERRRGGAGASAMSSKPRFLLEAYEVSRLRFSLLHDMMSRALSSQSPDCLHLSQHCLHLHNKSFLHVDPTSVEVQTVTHILLDPTCSASGITHKHPVEQYYYQHIHNTHTHKRKRAEQEERDQDSVDVDDTADPSVVSFSNSQLSLLLHALCFPRVVHVVYSTCSINVLENECVIARALSSPGVHASGWEVESGLLPHWTRRGVDVSNHQPLTKAECERMIRCDPETDHMNGFFVCGLRKRDTRETDTEADIDREKGHAEPSREKAKRAERAERHNNSKRHKEWKT